DLSLAHPGMLKFLEQKFLSSLGSRRRGQENTLTSSEVTSKTPAWRQISFSGHTSCRAQAQTSQGRTVAIWTGYLTPSPHPNFRFFYLSRSSLGLGPQQICNRP
ncbi:mCG145252, partial [Mus musculus]